MKQAVMISPGLIHFKEVPMPDVLKTHEVLLKIHRIGICGSDIHVYHGKHPFTTYPVVQGHEYSGEIIRTGKAVSKLQAGMKVTVRPQRVCGKCNPCKNGFYNICQDLKVEGFQAPGCAQEFFVVPQERVMCIPENISYEQAALVEPLAVAAHATNRVNIKGKNVVVSGAGPIGNLTAQCARIRGAKKVMITDFNDFRLEIAARCGIEENVNLKKESFEEATRRVFKKEGFQAAFEAVGIENALSPLINRIEKGGEIIIIGVYEEAPRVNMAMVGEHEIKLIGSMMYRHEDYEEAVRFLSEGKIHTESFVTHRFPFEKYLQAYEFIERQGDKSLKVMIELC